MYATPVLLGQQSNRENFQRTIALFDDDTGQAIDISGRTLAAPGDFTAANWVVTCGTVVTASVSQLTIKDYPFGNEMQALALTVGAGLAIAAGSPVTIADAATGKNTMTGYVTSYAPATGKMVAQIGYSFLFEIRTVPENNWNDGYASSSYIGTDDNSLPVIQASLGNGISVVDVGKLLVNISANPSSTLNTAKLRHRTYNVGMTVFDGLDDTRQIFIGKLPILNGYVSSQPLPQASSNIYGLP
jgi:hypothetical protein